MRLHCGRYLAPASKALGPGTKNPKASANRFVVRLYSFHTKSCIAKPLHEHVPVYQKPFALVQELILEGTQQAQAALRKKENVTLTGTLDYQACDDKQCFNPASVPLSWTLTLKSLVRERPNLRK